MGRKAHRDKDRYYHLAKEQGYRARSAFKLVQINKKYDFLASSRVVLDLCAAPGGWLQVASKYCPVASTIIGVDLMPIRPIPNVITHIEDITTEKCRATLRKDLGRKKADVVLHDGAPNVGANWQKDAYGQAELVLHSLKLACDFLRPGGIFVTKVFRSADYHSLLWVFNNLFGKVESTKPHSSRSTSAEIFVVCRGFVAPHKLDPKMLDPKHVFKEVEIGKKSGFDMLHKKVDKKRHRDGYDDDMGIGMHRKVPVVDFMTAEDPIALLSTTNELVFDADSTEYLGHSSTSSDIKASCSDLKVLGRAEFKALLKWRLGFKRMQAAKKRAEAESKAEPEAVGVTPTLEGRLQDIDAEANKELASTAIRLAAKSKREKKKAAKLKAKALQRKALGMDGVSVDIADSDVMFSLRDIKKADALDEVRDTQGALISKADADEWGLDSEDEYLNKARRHLGPDDEDDSDFDDADYDAVLEDQLDRDFAQYQSNLSKRKAGSKETPGKRLTRRQRAAMEAKAAEDSMNAKLDVAHQNYLRLLAGVRDGDLEEGGGDGGDSDSDSDSEAHEGQMGGGGGSGAGMAGMEARLPTSRKRGRADSDVGDSDSDSDEYDDVAAPKERNVDPSVRASRWFSNPIFEDALAEADMEGLEGRVSQNMDDADSSDSDDADSDASGTMGDLPNVLASIPKSEREKRKERLRKQRERDEARAARRAIKDGDDTLEVVRGDGDMDEDDTLTAEEKARRKTKRDMIREGMGKVIDDEEDTKGKKAKKKKNKKGDSGFEVVPASEDPRNEEFDPEAHAEILALGKMMRKHSKAKALIDASYNRYSFAETSLPAWFAQDETRHMRPTLPIDRAEVDRIKARFRDLAARPITKVAEARARKKHRAMKTLEKAKKAAEAAIDRADVSTKSKLRALDRAARGVKSRGPPPSLVVARKTGAGGALAKGGATGGKVKFVDRRLRNDLRSQKRADKRKKGTRKRSRK